MPLFAGSRVYGEMWPSIIEKAWAKMYGDYHAMGNAGRIHESFQHLSDDTGDRYYMQDKGYTATNEKGQKFWARMKRWNAKNYMVFTGSLNTSWVEGQHLFTLIGVYDLTIDGKKQQWIRLRNPWGRTDWDGTQGINQAMYSEANLKKVRA